MRAEGLPPGLQAALDLCEGIRKDLFTLLETLNLRDWNLRASRDTWTVSEFFDHLLRAEIGTSKMARRLIRGDYAAAVRPTGVRLYDSTLDVYPYGR